MFDTFDSLVQEKNDDTFSESDAEQLRENLLVTSPLGPFLMARIKSKQFLETKYCAWRKSLEES